jgi:hypothetical protein
MPVLFLGALLGPLLLSPLWSQHVFHETYRLERAQIAVDNAGIVLGSADRQLFNRLVAANRMVRVLEAAHHPLHLCARVPQSAAACLDKDLALELELRSLQSSITEAARVAWVASLQRALSRIRLEGSRPLPPRRPSFPVREVLCPVCQMKAGWEVAQPAVHSTLGAHASLPTGVGVRLVGRSLATGNWNYRLLPMGEEP